MRRLQKDARNPVGEVRRRGKEVALMARKFKIPKLVNLSQTRRGSKPLLRKAPKPRPNRKVPK
jgi:hypothetical protein